MRILFTSVSAHGHLLPLVPLMTAALDDGHQVAVIVSEGLAATVHDELPNGVDFLPAGPMPFELATEAARRTGGDVMHPTVEGIGETFGGVLLDLSVDDALPAARAWRPDIVVAEMFNSLGGFLAADLGIPWYRVKVSLELPPSWVAAIGAASARRFEAHGLRPTDPAGTLELWPSALRGSTPDAYPDVPTQSLRARAHRRGDAERPARTVDRDRPRVLVTLGTIFSDPDVLAAVVDEVTRAVPDAVVTATLGLALGAAPTTAAVSDDRVEYVAFVPIDDLLDGVAAVVSVGGAGTVLATLSRGVPMVIWPQGADQPAIAAAVGAAGAAEVVDDLAAIGPAVRDVLADPVRRDAARAVAYDLQAADDPHEVVRALVAP